MSISAKAYFSQAYLIDQKINSGIEELNQLRLLMMSIPAVKISDQVQMSVNTGAFFEKTYMKVEALEKKLDEQIDIYVDLKEQMRRTIDSLQNPDEKMVLFYRYFLWKSIAQIGAKMNVTKRSVCRWHKAALEHVVLPEKPIIIKRDLTV